MTKLREEFDSWNWSNAKAGHCQARCTACTEISKKEEHRCGKINPITGKECGKRGEADMFEKQSIKNAKKFCKPHLVRCKECHEEGVKDRAVKKKKTGSAK